MNCRDCNQDVQTPCRNSNDRAGCYRFNQEPETAGGKCPVCGETKRRKNIWSNKVGRFICTPVDDGFVGPCIHAERLAIERAAEVERLTARVAELYQFAWYILHTGCRACDANKLLNLEMPKETRKTTLTT